MIQVVRGDNTLFKVEFSVITDIASLAIMSLFNTVKLLYPDAEIKATVCKDEPLIATPLVDSVIRNYLSMKQNNNKFG